MKAAKYAWATESQPDYVVGLEGDPVDGGEFLSLSNAYIKVQAIDPALFPRILWVPNERESYHLGRRQRQIIDWGRGLIVSEAIANPLTQFELGDVHLVPVDIYFLDRTNRTELSYYHLVVNEILDPIIENQSVGFKPDPTYGSIFLDSFPKDGLAVSASKVGKLNVWRVPRTISMMFLSSAVFDALRAAGLTRYFHAKRCRLVADVIGQTPDKEAP